MFKPKVDFVRYESIIPIPDLIEIDYPAFNVPIIR